MKRYLVASIICWAAFTLLLIYCCSGCASQTFRIASDAEIQVRRLAIPAMSSERRSHIECVEAGEPFRANCDTYARTVADVLIQGGADPADVWLLIGYVPPSGIQFFDRGNGLERVSKMGHMVVFFRGLIIDNRKPYVSKFSAVDYEWHIMCRMDRAGGWEPVNEDVLGVAI